MAYRFSKQRILFLTAQSRLGHYAISTVAGEAVRAYLPPPLPPTPPVDLGGKMALLDLASAALGRLDGATSLLPAPPLFVFMYVRKEALLSSQIEGTQSSLADLLLFEADEVPHVPLEDVEEVSSYVKAIGHGLERIRSGFPLSLRLIREIHAVLLQTGRGSGASPGEFRASQNWIGGTRPGNAQFVPPPPHRLMECLDAFERFLHAPAQDLPVLVKAALAHVQFETIHPFLDGNGRLGRLLITLLLCSEGALREPILYLSLWFKTHRAEYYALLQKVREDGDWESWVEFFLTGVVETANQATATARRLFGLFEEDRKLIHGLGRPSTSALRVHEYLQRKPLVSIARGAREIGISQPTMQKSLMHLVDLGIVREITGKQRRRVFSYVRYLGMMDEGTEPL